MYILGPFAYQPSSSRIDKSMKGKRQALTSTHADQYARALRTRITHVRIMSNESRTRIDQALLRYSELDTLAMVMIVEAGMHLSIAAEK